MASHLDNERDPLIADQRQARLLWVYHFNFGVCLCRLTRFAGAVREVAAARELAVALRNDLDLARVLWLEGQVLAGLGRREEAIVALRQVREDLARHRLPADGALATLELAVLLLEKGRTGEVRELALEMLPIFGSLGFGEEALAALRLFWEAAAQETATAELGRRLLAFLDRARYDPDVRFS
jgi:tetratricopeptide (TPR) repeat protein